MVLSSSPNWVKPISSALWTKFLAMSKKRLAAKVNLIVTLDARHYIAKNGFDEKLGARPIERFINDKISRPLSKELLGRLEKGAVRFP